MLPGDSQFINPNPPRPPGPIRPPVGTINPVKPGVGGNTKPNKEIREKNGVGSKPPTTDGKKTAPMPIKPGYKPNQTTLPYNKNNSKKLGRGF